MNMTQFYTIYSLNHYYTINQNPDPKIKTPTPTVIQEYVDHFVKLDSYLHSEMIWAQASHSEQVDKYRILVLKLKVGDQV